MICRRIVIALSASMLLFSTARAADKSTDSAGDKTADKVTPPATDKPVRRTGSQFFYQTPGGTQSATLTFGYEMDSTTVSGNSYSQSLVGFSPIGVTYEYGINQKYAVSAALAYTNESSSGTPGQSGSTVSGIGDLDLAFKAVSKMKKMALHYGALLVVPNGNHSVDNSGNENTASGGFALDPYIGLETIVGHGYLGGRFTYDYQADRSVGTPTASETVSGGSAWELAAFYEYKLRSTLLGSDLRYYSIGNQTANGATKVKDYTQTSIDICADIALAAFELIPKLAYTISLGGDEYAKGSLMNFSLAGRWTF